MPYSPRAYHLAVRKSGYNPFQQVATEIAEKESDSFNIFGKVFDLLGRPGSAVAGFTTGLIEGDISRGFKRAGQGLTGKKFFHFDDVLKKLGVPKGKTGVKIPFLGEISFRGTLGFGLDILTDPLTYVGLGSLTKSGKALRKGLNLKQQKKLASIVGSYRDSIARKSEVLISRGQREVSSMFDNAVAKAKERFELTGVLPEEAKEFVALKTGRRPRNGLTTTEAEAAFRKEVVQAGPTLTPSELSKIRDKYFNTKPIVGVNEEVRQGMLDLKRRQMKDVFERTVLPAEKEVFKKNIDHAFGKGAEGLEDILDSATLLDHAISANSQLDLIRNLEDASGKVLASSRAIQAKYGQRALFTFAGKNPLESLGLPLGFKPEQLRAFDELVFKGVDRAFSKVNSWPIFQQTRRMLTNKTGLRPLDAFLDKMRGVSTASQQSALISGLHIIERDLISKGGKSATEIRRYMEDVVDNLERDNPNNILGEVAGRGMDEDAVKDALFLRKRLDESFRAEQISGAKLGISTSYLSGYFPRELNQEVKELFDEAFLTPGVKHGIMLGASKARKGKFAKLTTNEINELFRESRLGLGVLERAFKRNKKLFARLKKADPEVASFFVDDPALAIANRLAASSRVVANREFTASALHNFGRRVTSRTAERAPGEVLVVPTEVFRAYDMVELSDSKIRQLIKKALGLPPNTSNSIVDDIRETYQKIKSDELLKATPDAMVGESVGAPFKLFTEMSHLQPNTLAVMEDLGVPFYVIDKQVADKINDVWTIRRDGFAYNQAGKVFDGITTLWKRYTLTPFPSFHARNILSDIGWLNLLAGVTKPSEIFSKNGAYVHAFNILKESGIMGGVKGLEKSFSKSPGALVSVTAKDGTVLNGNKLMQEFIEGGGLGGLFRDVELSAHKGFDFLNNQLRDHFTKGAQKLKLRVNPLKPSFLPIELGTKIGDGLQVYARFAHYIAKRKAGRLADEAMMSMKKYLFDYNDLTTFERHTMRRIIPFYTWLRKNIPLQLEMMFRQPGKFAGLMHAVNSLEDKEIKRSLPPGSEPDFIKKEFGITTRKLENGSLEYLLLGSFVPAADLIKIGSIQDIYRLGAKSMHFLPQGMAESFTNQNFFTGLPIEQIPGEKGTFLGMAIGKKHINKLRKFRILNTIDRFVAPEDARDPYRKKGFTIPETLTQLATGLRPVRTDPEKIRKRRIFQSREIARQLNKALKRAEKSDDTAMFNYLKDLLEEAK